MKVGDLIKVQYEHETDQWYTGFVVEVPIPADPLSVYKMYCTERQAFHLLIPERDNIEVINEC